MVQFHQSYADEDFVQGWRPTETGGFTLRNGVFFEFCERAGKSPDTPFVFVIDEINRGNLSPGRAVSRCSLSGSRDWRRVVLGTARSSTPWLSAPIGLRSSSTGASGLPPRCRMS